MESEVAQGVGSYCSSIRVALRPRHLRRSQRRLSRVWNHRTSDGSSLDPHIVTKSKAWPVQKRMDGSEKGNFDCRVAWRGPVGFESLGLQERFRETRLFFPMTWLLRPQSDRPVTALPRAP